MNAKRHPRVPDLPIRGSPWNYIGVVILHLMHMVLDLVGAEPIITLDGRNFVKITDTGPMTYILFESPRCNTCQPFYDAFEEAAVTLQYEDYGGFAKVENSAKNKKIFDAFVVDRNYPKLNVFCAYTLDSDQGLLMTRVNPWTEATSAAEIIRFARDHKEYLPQLWNPALAGPKQRTWPKGTPTKEERNKKLTEKLRSNDKHVNANVNLAYGRPCNASSQLKDAGSVASLAVDGDRRSNFPNIFSVKYQETPGWWSVKLDTVEQNPTIRVFLRDCCVEDFGYAVRVHIGRTEFFEMSTTCGTARDLVDKGNNYIYCKGDGQYLFVSADGALTLAEVEVYRSSEHRDL